jgi:hypothetical protein
MSAIVTQGCVSIVEEASEIAKSLFSLDALDACEYRALSISPSSSILNVELPDGSNPGIGNRSAVEMTVRGKRGKPNVGFPLFPPPLEIPVGSPHSHRFDYDIHVSLNMNSFEIAVQPDRKSEL